MDAVLLVVLAVPDLVDIDPSSNVADGTIAAAVDTVAVVVDAVTVEEYALLVVVLVGPLC